MVYVNPAFHTGEHRGIRRILHGRLFPHQLHKASQAGGTIGKQLGKVGKLANGVDESRDVDAEGDKIHDIHLSGHDQTTAGRDHSRR